MFKKINSCRICNSKKLQMIINLGDQPLANALLKRGFRAEKKIPLKLVMCLTCKVLQLEHTVNPDILFKKYLWVTGTSEKAAEYRKFFFNRIEKLTFKKSFICEVASNDGFFLEIFKKNYEILGIDPAKNIAKIAKKKGINTIVDFFNYSLAKKIVIQKKKHADIVICRNVIPHIENIDQVMRGLEHLLSKRGTGIIEFHNASNILSKLHYDYIYHEHIFYFTLTSMVSTLQRYGLYVYDYFLSPISGGSYVVMFKKVKCKKSLKLKKQLKMERLLKKNNLSKWKSLHKMCQDHKINFLKKLINIFENNKTIGYGASARSSTLLNYLGIDSKIVHKIYDKNILKKNMYAPGSHIKIDVPNKKEILSSKVIILLAWNFAREIVIFLKKIKYKGKIILPLPKIKIFELK